MDRSTAMMKPSWRDFGGYHVFSGFMSHHSHSESDTFSSVWDNESPFPRMRSRSRIIPIVIDEPRETNPCKGSVVIIGDDEESKKDGYQPESPVPKTSLSKLRSTESNSSGRETKRKIPVLVDDDNIHSSFKRTIVRTDRPSYGGSDGHDRSKTTIDLCRRDLRSNPPSFPHKNDGSKQTDIVGNCNGVRSIPVIVLDDSGLKKNSQVGQSLSIHEKDISMGNTSDSSCGAREVNTPPNYPVYDTLQEMLLQENQQIDYIRGDGNCFFRALSKHLYRSERFHKAIRSLIIDLIATHKKEFVQFIDNEDVQHHVEAMSEDRSWATTCEVYAAATLLQRDLYMLTPSHTGGPDSYKWLLFTPVFSMEPQCREGGCQCFISLCNTNGNHYDRVVAVHGGCNCFLTRPQLDGISCDVDLTA